MTMSVQDKLAQFGARLHDAIHAANIPGNQAMADALAEDIIGLYRDAVDWGWAKEEENRRLQVMLRERRRDYRRSLQEITNAMDRVLTEARSRDMHPGEDSPAQEQPR